MYVTYEIFMCGRDVLECVISLYDVTYNRNVYYTLFFFCETSQKRKFCYKKMMYKIDILIKNSYVTYIAITGHFVQINREL